MKIVVTIFCAWVLNAFATDPCSESDKHQAEYLKTQSAVSFGLYMHNMALCFGTESTIDMPSCRRAETYRLNYLTSMKPSDMNKYMTELEYCMDKNKKR